MAYLYARANGDEPTLGFEEGLAIFSRHPVGSPRLAELGEGKSTFVRRIALGAQVEIPGGSLMVFTAHLGLGSRDNASQVNHLRSWVAGQAAGQTALVGGDFNTGERSPQIIQAQADWVDVYRLVQPHTPGDTHTLGYTFTAGRLSWLALRRKRLDYLFLHPGSAGWQVDWAEHLDGVGRSFSDHRAVVAGLHLNTS